MDAWEVICFFVDQNLQLSLMDILHTTSLQWEMDIAYSVQQFPSIPGQFNGWHAVCNDQMLAVD